MKLEIGAYYYPGWQGARGINEWNLVKNAKEYFKGQNLPPEPLIGFYDNSNKRTIEQQAGMAEKNGIDGFIFDWYWKKGKTELEEPVKEFMSAKADIKFALMRSWKMPKRDLPVMKGQPSKAEDERWVECDAEDFKKMLEYCAGNYFRNKKYWLVEGKPYLTLYFINGMLGVMGKEKLGEMIFEGKKHMKTLGFDGLFVSGVLSENVDVSGLGLDALTGYNFLPDFSGKGEVLQDYNMLAEKRNKDWNAISESSDLPYIPSISAGWDATPRGQKIENLFDENAFPWAPVVINNTPENFGSFLRKGLEFSKENKFPGIVNICAWNEWSEGAFIEPDKKKEFAMLNQIRSNRQELSV